ncbi:MAG TPA: hypothetical protein VM305_06205 [Candidatus Limnocylindrales bacterium]|nr:hypothetical protein [Candidatus Limnocylindrales bacterium]
MADSTPDPAGTSHAAGRWLALAALALVVALAGMVAEPLVEPDRQPLAASNGIIWAAMLAGAAGGLALVLSRPSGPGRLRWGALLALAVAVAAGGATAAYGVVAGAAGQSEPCSAAPLMADGAAIVHGRALIDGAETARIDAHPAEAAALGTLVPELDSVPLEDHGLEVLAGSEVRRCSVLIDGDMALRAMPPLAMLLDADPARSALPIWRGQLDWWTSAAGQLVAARVVVGGHPADAWPSRGLRGTIVGDMRLIRGAP